MTEKEKMLAGQIYDPSDDELLKLRQNAHILSKKYNDCFETDAQRTDLLHKLIPHMGENVYLQGPVQFDYGCFTEIGKNTYANFNFTRADRKIVSKPAIYIIFYFIRTKLFHLLSKCGKIII